MRINRYRGDTKRISYKLTSSNDPVDVTGWSFKMSISATENPETAAEYLINAVIDNATNGEIHFPFTIDIPAGSYFYDIQATDNNAEIETIEKHKMIISQDITK